MSALILDDAARFIRRFVIATDAQADTLALWVAHTHAIEAVDTTPYLAVTSPEKRSGKTRLLEVLELIVHDPLPAANTSDAALFRSVSKKDDLRGLLNAGFRRGAVVRRMGGAKNTTLETFQVFCPKAFAGIGNCLPDTILDRSISIELQRKTREEPVERFRRRDVVPEGESLRDRLADWLEPQVDWRTFAKDQVPA